MIKGSGNPKIIFARATITRLLLLIGLMIVGVAVFYGYILASTLKKIQLPSPQATIARLTLPDIGVKRLQGEHENRINLLLIGIGGPRHPGGLLADTIILASLKPKDSQVALMSIPRDLYVTFPKPLFGADKINAAHAIGEKESKSTGGGAIYMKKVVGDTFGLTVHYVIRVDFEGFRKLVDTLGGINITVDKPIYDPLYPAYNMIDFEPFSIKAGPQTLDGATALKYARSRETTSDFDRARRQQQIVQALRDKATGLNVLANPKKILDIAKIVGDHIKTDLSPGEVERLVTVSQGLAKAKLITKVLDNGPSGPLISVNDGGYYLKPRDGTYQELKSIAQNIFIRTPIDQENAKIEIINASSLSGAGSKLADDLTQAGVTVTRISKQNLLTQKSVIYDSTAGQKPQTVKYLADLLKTTVTVGRPDFLTGKNPAEIVIVIGNET